MMMTWIVVWVGFYAQPPSVVVEPCCGGSVVVAYIANGEVNALDACGVLGAGGADAACTKPRRS